MLIISHDEYYCTQLHYTTLYACVRPILKPLTQTRGDCTPILFKSKVITESIIIPILLYEQRTQGRIHKGGVGVRYTCSDFF